MIQKDFQSLQEGSSVVALKKLGGSPFSNVWPGQTGIVFMTYWDDSSYADYVGVEFENHQCILVSAGHIDLYYTVESK